MKKNALLIDENAFKLFIPVSANLDWDYLTPHVIVAQDKHIQPIIGTQLFQKIVDLIDSGTIGDPANAEYDNLCHDFIAKCLCHSTMYEAYPSLPVKVLNNTIIRANLEDGDAIDLEESYNLRQNEKAIADFYAERLFAFLEESNIIEYKSDNAEDLKGGTNNGTTFGLSLTDY